MRQKTPSKMRKIVTTVISGVLAVVIIGVMVAANVLLPDPQNSRMADNFVGRPDYIDNSKVDAEDYDLDYYKSDFSPEELPVAESAMSRQIVEQGTVLLKNDRDLLPLAAETTVSLFSANAVPKDQGGLSAFYQSSQVGLKTAFENAGLGVNSQLWNYYAEGAGARCGLGPGSIEYGDAEDFSINECSLDSILSTGGLEDSLKGTVPVYVLNRVAGEGRDMPRSMYNHASSTEDKERSYLEPDSTELEILSYLNDNFDDTVLLITSNAALELEWLQDFPNISSVVLSEGGRDEVADIFTGAVNPSGRTVDTFAADASRSPAAQNFGDYQYVDENGELTKYNYITYKEGIYVGYKYYETRYEDFVLAQGNAGDYDYKAEIVYPFGYGLSYTDFSWSNYSTVWNGDTATVTVDVTNIGDKPGRDVVEIYAQSPYTDYDRENFVEKSAVALVGMGKTEILEPGQVETLTVEFEESQLKSYDYHNAQTYILEEGDYWVTAGKNAHDAVNNILAAKGKTVADGMTADGDRTLTSLYNPNAKGVDSKKYSVDSTSGTAIQNLFEDAKGDYTYLSRADWVGTWPTSDGEPSDTVISTWGNEINGVDDDGSPASFTRIKEATADEIAQLDSFDSLTPIDPESITDTPVYGQKNDIKLIEMRGVAFDDDKWEKFLDQLQPDEYQDIITWSGYGTMAVDSVNKPFAVDADAASGLLYGGTGAMYPVMMLLAQTWNADLAYDYGSLIGNAALSGGANGWYAPSMNIHRTPFSGRNGEYYSEDGWLSGAFGAGATKGASDKGLYTFIKHFVVNEQENHRGDRDGQFGLATWTNEQALREIYLTPFEMSIKSGDVEVKYLEDDGHGGFTEATTKVPASQGIMTAFNRLGYTWTGGHYPLITGLVRDEWGFDGFIITDNANTGLFMDGYQMIESGADAKLTAQKTSGRYEFDRDNSAEYKYGRDAMHRVMYTVANSNAMNGAMPGSEFVAPLKTTQIVQIAVNVGGAILLVLLGGLTVWRFWPRKSRLSSAENANTTRESE